MKKIRFMAEAVSWLQMIRLLVLAWGLSPNKYEIHFASARFYERLFHGTSFTRWPIGLLSADKIEAVVASGSIRRTYDKAARETAEKKDDAAKDDLKVVRLSLSAPRHRG